MSTPDVAQRSVPSSAASRARSFNSARGVAAAAAAFVILVGTTSVDRLLAVFWRFGLAFGFVLQRSRFCFASAFRFQAQYTSAGKPSRMPITSCMLFPLRNWPA